MSDRDPGDEPPRHPAEDANLRDRLGHLSRQLDAKAPAPERNFGSVSARDTKGWAQAMRISSEFIAGIIVGGGIGWGLDWAFGWSPFGLIVFLLLGFAAGILNVLRSLGEVSEPGAGVRRKNRDKSD